MHVSTLTASSPAFTALIWWLVPLAGVIGALVYILWVSKFKRKFEKGTSRSVNQFERFQNSFRDNAMRDNAFRDNAMRDSLEEDKNQRDNEPKS
jgi:hypothetical protein